MCGIVGLFLKDPKLEPQLGAMLTDMLITMTDRGPDSAGIAIYGRPEKGKAKLTVQSADPDTDFATLVDDLGKAIACKVTGVVKDTHMVLELPEDRLDAARHAMRDLRPKAKVMSAGEGIEIYKEVGLPKDVAARFEVARMSGTHGIGHTRMATESAVTTMGAHPFSTGADQCLVHNGSLSNHNSVRRVLKQAGMTFETENDTEVAAAFISHKLQEGAKLGEAMEAEALLSEAYVLEISSPGLSDALVEDRDFHSFRGFPIEVRFRDSDGTESTRAGLLLERDDAFLHLNVHGRRQRIPRHDVLAVSLTRPSE
jgi:glutamate synthase domain-containing protein 1